MMYYRDSVTEASWQLLKELKRKKFWKVAGQWPVFPCRHRKFYLP